MTDILQEDLLALIAVQLVASFSAGVCGQMEWCGAQSRCVKPGKSKYNDSNQVESKTNREGTESRAGMPVEGVKRLGDVNCGCPLLPVRVDVSEPPSERGR